MQKEKNPQVYERKMGDIEEANLDDHLISPEELEIFLKTSLKNGLTNSEAERRLLEYGPNALTPPKKTPECLKFLKTLFTGFAALLWIAAILCFVAYGIGTIDGDEVPKDNLYIGFALVLVVLISGIFTYFQEHQSDQIMESFKNMVPVEAEVIRDNEIKSIDATTLVKGDIIIVKGGDKVPADIRIFESQSLKVRNINYVF